MHLHSYARNIPEFLAYPRKRTEIFLESGSQGIFSLQSFQIFYLIFFMQREEKLFRDRTHRAEDISRPSTEIIVMTAGGNRFLSRQITREDYTRNREDFSNQPGDLRSDLIPVNPTIRIASLWMRGIFSRKQRCEGLSKIGTFRYNPDAFK